MKIKIISTRAYTYPGQCVPQGRFFEVYPDGSVEVDVSPEIGNGVPSKVWHGKIIRLHIPHGPTREDIRAFYRIHRAEFARLVAGLSVEWNGSNYVGRLTEDAIGAQEWLEHALQNWQVAP